MKRDNRRDEGTAPRLNAITNEIDKNRNWGAKNYVPFKDRCKAASDPDPVRHFLARTAGTTDRGRRKVAAITLPKLKCLSEAED
jgi:hypothetical protein